MNVVAWILGALLVAVFGFAGVTKLIDLDRSRERLGYARSQFRMIGAAEIGAAAAIVVGLIWRSVEWIAVAAGLGICSLMVGALLAHARVSDDLKTTMPAGVMFLLSIVFMVVISLR